MPHSNHKWRMEVAPSIIETVPENLWRNELEQSSIKFHNIAAWVAVVFVPVFGITDYINIPDHWHEIFYLRIFNSLICLLLIFNRKRWHLSAAVFAAIPFFLISFQNSFTFRYLNEDQIVQHALNYIALMIGAGMFLMWDLRTSLAVLIPSALATCFFAGFNPKITVEAYLENGGLLITCVAVFMAVVIEFRRRISIREIKATLALKAANEELVRQKAEIGAKNEAISESIRYAERLQKSMLGTGSVIKEWFKDSMLLFLPKDVLSGDFYWFHEDANSGTRIIAVADCTGHGVPAAMMTVMGQGLLSRVVVEQGITDAKRILESLDTEVKKAFEHGTELGGRVNDGMDMAVVILDGNRLSYSGARMPLLIVRKGGMVTNIRASRFPVGSNQYDDSKEYETHKMDLSQGDRLYLFSDGYPDQFGGPSDKRFQTRGILNMLSDTHNVPMKEQYQLLLSKHLEWKGANEQTDDILLLGVEV